MTPAILEACLVSTALRNSGKECDIAMVAAAQFWITPPDWSLTREQLADPVTTFRNGIHAAKGSRIYPIFGQKAPIREITNAGGDDVSVTMDDGLEVFLRFNLYNNTYATTNGGLCYAKMLQDMGQSGYNALKIDAKGQGLFRKNDDGTFGSLITDYMTAPSPTEADLKSTPYKNRFRISYSPVEMVQNGVVMKNCGPLLSMMGLIDSEITEAAAATNATPAVAPTRTITITDEGTDGSTIDIPGITAASISGGPVIKTSAENTVTLLAVKIKAAINALTSITGYSADNAAGVLTITAPLSAGANTTDLAPTIVGDITASHTAFSGGTTAISTIRIGVRTECAHTDLIARFGNALASHIANFVVTDEDGNVVTASSATLTSGYVALVGPWVQGKTYSVAGAAPSVWLGNSVAGYDAEDFPAEIAIP